MTDTVLPSDIELAKRLIAAGCQESGIIVCLCWRGVGTQQASNLVHQLRQGRRLDPLVLECSTIGRTHHRPGRSRRGHGNSGMCLASRRHRRRHHRPTWQRVVKRALRWSVAVAGCLLVLSSMVLVGHSFYRGAVKNAEDRYNRNPSWRLNVSRWQEGLPAPVSDLGPPRAGSRPAGADFSAAMGFPPLPSVGRLKESLTAK